MSFKTIELYGGAFEIQVPERFVDISHYRHIPDHQEVYIDPSGDQSIITELNSYQNVPDSDAITLHWDDLMKDSDSSSIEIISKGEFKREELPNIPKYVDYIGYIDGVNQVGKYKEEKLNTVHTYIVNMRMACVTTDFLIIFNVPLAISQDSTAADMVKTDDTDQSSTEMKDETNVEEEIKAKLLTKEESGKLINEVIKSFKIKSMSIFPEMQ